MRGIQTKAKLHQLLHVFQTSSKYWNIEAYLRAFEEQLLNADTFFWHVQI